MLTLISQLSWCANFKEYNIFQDDYITEMGNIVKEFNMEHINNLDSNDNMQYYFDEIQNQIQDIIDDNNQDEDRSVYFMLDKPVFVRINQNKCFILDENKAYYSKECKNTILEIINMFYNNMVELNEDIDLDTYPNDIINVLIVHTFPKGEPFLIIPGGSFDLPKN